MSERAVLPPGGDPPPLLGRLIYRLVPVRRRVILANLRRVYGADADARAVRGLAAAHYAHLARSLWEICVEPRRGRPAGVRLENVEAGLAAHAQGRGVLLLAAHLGNWEIAATRGLAAFPQARGRIHVVRRPLSPGLDGFVARRFRRAGLGVLPKRGSLDRLLDRLAAGDGVVFLLDQFAAGRDGVAVDFFGTPTGTFRSLAIVARATGAPVVPVATWRAAAGHHVVRFETALAWIARPDADEAIRVNTRAYNAALEALILRCPEQWFWAHRRWKRVER